MSYLLYAVLPLVGFFIGVGVAKRFREASWEKSVVEGVIGAVVGLGISFSGDIITAGCCEYVFDSDSGLGWNVPNTDSDRALRGGALISRRYSAERAHGKGGSLQVEVHLMGGGGAAMPMNRGEVSVLLRQFPPVGGVVGVAQNLWLARVEAIVDVPATLESTQSAVGASFIQLYIETCPPESRRIDGEPGEQIHDAGPIRISYRWWAFDALEACRLGIKIGLNDADLSSYRGDVFISGVRWTPLSWYLQRGLIVALLMIGGVAAYLRVARKSHRAGAPAERVEETEHQEPS
jgi:hypothetical protein